MSKKRFLSPAAWSVLVAGVLLALVVSITSPLPAQEESDALTTAIFHVEGMTCGGCEVGVRLVLNKLDGVDDVEASYKEESAVVTYESAKVTPEDIIAAIADLGYTAELEDGENSDTEGSRK